MGNDIQKTISTILGLLWDRVKGTIAISLICLENFEIEKVTKGTILSAAHKVFDLIVIVSPVFSLPKTLLQKLWSSGFSCVMEVGDTTKAKFLIYCKELASLKEFSIPRWLSYYDDRDFSIHLFSNASLYVCAAAVFIRVETSTGVNVHLLASKARVKPMKTVTIPGLELIATMAGVRLCTPVWKGLNWKNVQLCCLIDFSNVLHCIQRHEIWSVFVNS